MNASQKGEVIIEGDYATLKYERRLAHSPRRRLEGNYGSNRAGNVVR